MDMKERLQELAENARVRIEESEGLDKLMMCVWHILEKRESLPQS